MFVENPATGETRFRLGKGLETKMILMSPFHTWRLRGLDKMRAYCWMLVDPSTA